MKWLNILLSIYLLALACMPCADVEINHSRTVAQNEAVADHHNSTEKHGDHCSPFCSCSCCGTQLLNYIPASIFECDEAIGLIAVPLPTYTSILTSNFYGSIWQPPQLV